MREIQIQPNEAGQRLDKFLHKYMKDAPASFFYKMMRKKNIVLNGTKCTGQEILQINDQIKLFLAEETFEKFGAPAESGKNEDPRHKQLINEATKAFEKYGMVPVIYEDAHILAVNKPAGMLTQKAKTEDLSLNEWLIGYLLSNGQISVQQLHTFHPSVCNRLDRNTSGLVLCAKSLAGAQFLTSVLKNRSVHKYYRLFVKGEPGEAVLSGWLTKNKKTNKVQIRSSRPENDTEAVEIKTGIKPLDSFTYAGYKLTYAQAELFTGKSHQIRAHFAFIGHCLAGDEKYGDADLNRKIRSLGCNGQMLHAYKIVFPKQIEGNFSELSGMILTAPEPECFRKLLAVCTAENVAKEEKK